MSEGKGLNVPKSDSSMAIVQRHYCLMSIAICPGATGCKKCLFFHDNLAQFKKKYKSSFLSVEVEDVIDVLERLLTATKDNVFQYGGDPEKDKDVIDGEKLLKILKILPKT